jgi:hypothetical protein
MELEPAITTIVDAQSTASSQGEEKEAADVAPIATQRWKKYVNAFLAEELSTLTRYYDRLILWLPRVEDTGGLLAAMDAPVKQTVKREQPFPDLSSETRNARQS